jgi:hypothetical protein
MTYRSAALFTLVVAQVLSLTALCASASQGGLKPAQLRQLRSVPFAVVPAAAPPGFHVRSVSVDSWNHTYTIVYGGPQGATIRIFGSERAPGVPVAHQGGAPPQPHGLFQKLAGAFSHITHTSNALHSANAQAGSNANSHSGTAGEEEEEMSALSADNEELGPVNFATSNRCVKGTNDPAKAKIKSATFEVDGCNMRVPDALVRAYRSLERVH